MRRPSAGGLSNDAQRQKLRATLERNLRQHILSPWYPRAVDREHGGFHQTYAEDWTPKPDTARSLVYQSRLTWVASQAVQRYPKEAGTWRARVRHGLDYLAGPLHDPQHGAWFWEIGLGGKPDAPRGGEKHAYGISFALYATAAAYHATRDPQALALAQQGFRWLEEHAHDTQHGGYFEALSREGAPRMQPPAPDTKDAIGTQYGLKSMNTHIHLLEAFTELKGVWPDALLRQRLEEVFHIVRDRVTQKSGYLALYFKPDWTPVPDHDSFGHDVETAYLLVEAAHALGIPNDKTPWATARRLMDHALRFGWDRQHGGFYDAGEPDGKVTNPAKIWWTEAEGLNALLLMDQRYGKQDRRYGEAFLKQWGFIERFQVDSLRGGWRTEVSANGKPIPGRTKSDAWKDPYHQGRALLRVTESLRTYGSE